MLNFKINWELYSEIWFENSKHVTLSSELRETWINSKTESDLTKIKQYITSFPNWHAINTVAKGFSIL